jgi:hypothetical protein
MDGKWRYLDITFHADPASGLVGDFIKKLLRQASFALPDYTDPISGGD